MLEGGTLSTPADLIDRHGLIGAAAAAVQIDITSVQRRVGGQFVETSLCDHNCTISHNGESTGGHYNCPAAFSLNRGSIAATAPVADQLIEGIQRTLSAASSAQADFMVNEFEHYADSFSLPLDVRLAARAKIGSGPCEVTLFGGSPEAHREIEQLTSGLRRCGHEVHITVTGRRFIRRPEHLETLANSGVAVVAVSLDDVDRVADLRSMFALTPEELRAAWRAVPKMHGQRQKVFEAVHAARLWESMPATNRPGLLFNIAVHQGNVDEIDELLTTLADEFPGVALNPFPLQSAFEHRIEVAGPRVRRQFEAFVREALSQQTLGSLEQRWRLVPRLHYWLALAATLDAGSGTAGITGWGTWRCYRSAGAARYTQVAETGRASDRPGSAGGHLGCFWNSTIDSRTLPAIWDADTTSIRRYLDLRPVKAAAQLRPCPGCMFPRLVGDMVSLECGLGDHLKPYYLARRRQSMGF